MSTVTRATLLDAVDAHTVGWTVISSFEARIVGVNGREGRLALVGDDLWISLTDGDHRLVQTIDDVVEVLGKTGKEAQP